MNQGRNIILQHIKNGDESSFRSIFEEYYSPLVSFANSYLLDRAEAEDVVQTVLINLWEKARYLEIESSIDAYLFTCVKNSCLNQLKVLNIRDKNNILFVEGLMSYYSENDRVDPNLEQKLKLAIAELPARVQEIIRLRYGRSKKISEISTILDISENTVKTQLKRGKEKLRKHFRVSGQTLTATLVMLGDQLF